VELYFWASKAQRNKSHFDQLYSQRAEVEAAVPFPISWQRLDEKKACRICVVLEHGGYEDAETWDVAIPATVDAMIALRTELMPRVAMLEG